MKNCPKCQTPHSKAGVYCSRRCANSRIWSAEDKIKKSIAAKSSDHVDRANMVRRKSPRQVNCPICTQPLLTERRKTCGNARCVEENRLKKFRVTVACNKKSGGYRANAGRSIKGYYKNIYCGSTYELAFLVWHLDHQSNIQRCEQVFVYGDNKKYYPDFEIDGTIFEIKGFATPSVLLKAEAVAQAQIPYRILYKADLKEYLDYVRETYQVKNLSELYENVIHRFSYECWTCHKTIKTNKARKSTRKFCSTKCLRSKRYCDKFNQSKFLV